MNKHTKQFDYFSNGIYFSYEWIFIYLAYLIIFQLKYFLSLTEDDPHKLNELFFI